MANDSDIQINKESKNSTRIYKQDSTIDCHSGNIVSNDSSLFGGQDIGTSKEIILYLSKKEFTDKYLSALQHLFELTETQIRIMRGFLTMGQFRDSIRWDTNTIQSLADKTGLTVFTLRRYFPSLHLHKKLLVKIKNGKYHINRSIVYHVEDLSRLNLARLTFSFKFKTEQETLKEQSEQAQRMANELRDMYNDSVRNQNPVK